MSLSVIIPSRDASNLVPCVEAVRKHEKTARIIVVDDGLDLHPKDAESSDCCWLCDVGNSIIVLGQKPFVFARNVNLGINAAGTDDVVLLNDDALLETPGGFSLLQQAHREHPEYGIIASTCNNVGNMNQWQLGIGLREDPRMVCFVSVFIPRSTIDTVGLLDQRYTGYGMDDDDYCFSVRAAGLKIGIHDGCYCDHGSLHSTYRGNPRQPADFSGNLRLFKEKWGHDNWGRA